MIWAVHAHAHAHAHVEIEVGACEVNCTVRLETDDYVVLAEELGREASPGVHHQWTLEAAFPGKSRNALVKFNRGFGAVPPAP